MTKKDYELIAKAIKNATADLIISANTETTDNIVWGLALELEKENPKFNRNKFVKACGLDDL